LLEACLAIDPEHVDAALRFTDILWDRKQYADAFPHLQMLVRKLESKQATRNCWPRYITGSGRLRNQGELEKASSILQGLSNR
jgi:hypothetical protein